MKTTEKDALHIVAIVRALHDAQRFLGGLSAEEFAENDEKQNAVAMAIARAGEHARKLSKEFRESKSGVPWRGVSGMRDWIAHDYDGLDFDRLYYAVTHEVPEVLAVLQPYVEQQAQVQLTKRNPFEGKGSEYDIPACAGLFPYEPDYKLFKSVCRGLLRAEAQEYGLLPDDAVDARTIPDDVLGELGLTAEEVGQ